MPITPDISRKLLDLKEECGLTFKQIGDEVGSSEANVRRYIMGETKAPDKQLLYAIIRSMGGDPEELLGKKKPEQPASPQPQQQMIDYSLLERQEKRHQQEIANLKAAYHATIISKDERIDELKMEKRHLRVSVLVMAAVILLFILIYLIPDFTNGDWGHILYSMLP